MLCKNFCDNVIASKILWYYYITRILPTPKLENQSTVLLLIISYFMKPLYICIYG